jgi:signal transduction histidine kinase
MSLFARPRRSIRLRLAALLTALFLLLGGTLLGVSYALVRSSLTRHPDGDAGTARLHESLPPEERRLVVEQTRAARDQLADDALRELTVQYLAIIAAMAVVSGALGWFVSGRVLRPMSEITATARRVSKDSLHERIALEGPEDELKQLADTFDSMLARLEAGVERERAFARNASHELRTPLSVIHTEADVTLADEPDDPDALRRSLAVVRDAGRRSERLVDALLTLARANRDDYQRIEVDLSQLLRELTKEIDLHDLRLELDLRPARVLGDRDLLRTMATNLIDNAAEHNTPDGWIEIGTESAGREARLEIANSGEVITIEQAASLTEPFRRLGTARTGNGHGLGLSIAASVAQAHGGRLAIEPLTRGGLRVSIWLPAAPVSGDRSDGDLEPSRAIRAGTERAPTADAGPAPVPGHDPR